MEDDRRRHAFLDVMERGDLGGFAAELLLVEAGAEALEVKAGKRRHHGAGVEEHERVGQAGDRLVVLRGVESGQGGDRGGEVSTGRTTADGDALRVDAEARGVGADPAHASFGVGDAIGRLGVLAGLDAIVGDDGDHAAGGEVSALRLELGR